MITVTAWTTATPCEAGRVGGIIDGHLVGSFRTKSHAEGLLMKYGKPATKGLFAAAVISAGMVSSLVARRSSLVARRSSLVAPAAADASTFQDCPQSSFCLYEHANFNGWMISFTRSSVTIGGAWIPNDAVSSAVNKSPVSWCVYENSDRSGRFVTFPPNTQIQDFETYNFNDAASSVDMCP
ncbi:peptidase inhibitor family I36 protein [Amycolatopsis pigmentata]|uniref:Peptidase inhibitor family I36 protein n=1 Tax=Amycolatopsis pigmentata TaxID=450801 RepID=A0ABW5G6I4_9PSEU